MTLAQIRRRRPTRRCPVHGTTLRARDWCNKCGDYVEPEEIEQPTEAERLNDGFGLLLDLENNA